MEVQEAERQRVFVLSAFPEFLLDYFRVKLWEAVENKCETYKKSDE